MNETATAKREINIALIGRRGHGKTLLFECLAAAAGKAVPKAPKEPRRQSLLGRLFQRQPREPKESPNGEDVITFEVERATCRLRFADVRAEPGYLQKYKQALGHIDGVILVCNPLGAEILEPLNHVKEAQRVGASEVVVVISHCEQLVGRDFEELIDLAEIELRDGLQRMGFDGGRLPVIRGWGRTGSTTEDIRAMRSRLLDLMSTVESQMA